MQQRGDEVEKRPQLQWLLQVRGVHEVLRAAVNTAVAVPVFFLLDRTRMDE